MKQLKMSYNFNINCCIIQEDLVGNNVFDYIHPKDVAKVKEQLSCSDFGPRDKYINANSKFKFCYFI